jgi:glutaminyl-peptide cyclotransferase
MKKFKVFTIAVSTVLTAITISCSDEKKSSTHEVKTETVTTPAVDTTSKTIPLFNEDSAYQYIAQQLAFGPRVPNTDAHVACGLFLNKFFQRQGGWVYTQNFSATAFDGKSLSLRNFIASYNVKATKRIIIASHWDSRPFADQDVKDQKKPILGANDGASGVAIMMEMARAMHLSKEKPAVGIDFILFDGEDYGAPEGYEGANKSETWCLGSQHWAKEKHRGDYTAYYGVLLDMVGGYNAKFALEGNSRLYAPSVLKNIWSQAQSIGYGNYFINENSPEIIDDHLYVNQIAKIPMVDIIQYDASKGGYFADYWHTHNDNLNAIDKKTLKAVGSTLLHVLYKEKP